MSITPNTRHGCCSSSALPTRPPVTRDTVTLTMDINMPTAAAHLALLTLDYNHRRRQLPVKTTISGAQQRSLKDSFVAENQKSKAKAAAFFDCYWMIVRQMNNNVPCSGILLTVLCAMCSATSSKLSVSGGTSEVFLHVDNVGHVGNGHN